jgi:hypothetical protein
MKTLFVSVFFVFVSSLLQGQTVTLENDYLKVVFNKSDANFTLTHKESGKVWLPDPWVDKAAGFIDIRSDDSKNLRMNLSKSAAIKVEALDKQSAAISFENFTGDDGKVISGYVRFTLQIFPDKPDMDITLIDFSCKEGQISRIEYPARHFSLTWEKDRGMGVLPYLQGLVIPSYLFPRPNSKFGHLDDYQGDIVEMDVYGWAGLSMPWYGIHDENCAIVTTMPYNGSVKLQCIFNSNNVEYWHQTMRTESRDKKILAFTPVWAGTQNAKNQTLNYHFINKGTHAEMARHYREIAIKNGLFVSLETKAKKQQGVEKMKGAIYFHLYGGYPHYVNNDEMDFTFDEMAATIKDIHDNKKVRNAIITVWGAYENYPPTHIPYNIKAGGEAKLRNAYDLAKSYGYLITNYHSWTAALERDPLYNPDWIKLDASGKRSFRGQWGGSMDKKLFLSFAKHTMEYEMPALKPNLFYSDAITSTEVAKYTDSLNLPVTMERNGDSEQYVKYYACYEGMTPYNLKSPTWSALEVPLFNLVYHDAVFTTNRWQSPDNDYDMNGDFQTRELRNMLYGSMPVFVVPLWEYPGISDMIEMVNKTVVPLNRDIAYSEMTSHQFLTSDLNVQRSRFSNGAEVTVNFALTENKLPGGEIIPGYGFLIKLSDGKIIEGSFKTSILFKRK